MGWLETVCTDGSSVHAQSAGFRGVGNPFRAFRRDATSIDLKLARHRRERRCFSRRCWLPTAELYTPSRGDRDSGPVCFYARAWPTVADPTEYVAVRVAAVCFVRWTRRILSSPSTAAPCILYSNRLSSFVRTSRTAIEKRLPCNGNGTQQLSVSVDTFVPLFVLNERSHHTRTS